MDLQRATLQSWLIVLLLAAGTMLVLFGIVRRGSRTIEFQSQALQQRISHLSSLLKQNEELRRRVEESSERAADANERFLRRVSAELHDGPAQLIGFALLRLDALMAPSENQAEAEIDTTGSVEVIRSVLSDSLSEIRNLSAGLALPEIEGLSPNEALRIAVSNHERRTQTAVRVALDNLPSGLPRSIKICLFRFVQEGLNNAFKHADGRGQALEAVLAGALLTVKIIDDGAGFSLSELDHKAGRLGLNGLKDRIENLGGQFDIRSEAGTGTVLTASFALDQLEGAK